MRKDGARRRGPRLPLRRTASEWAPPHRAPPRNSEEPPPHRGPVLSGSAPVLVADGGMGALVSAAVPRLRVPEEANVRAPDAVVSLHVGFINAGADLIETNTFGANRLKLAAHYLEDEFE